MIIIKEVKGKRMLKKFIDFPLSLYKNCPYFTPYLFEDELANLTPGKIQRLDIVILNCFWLIKTIK